MLQAAKSEMLARRDPGECGELSVDTRGARLLTSTISHRAMRCSARYAWTAVPALVFIFTSVIPAHAQESNSLIANCADGTPNCARSTTPAESIITSTDTHIIGNPPDANTGNCFPFGYARFWPPQYQQVYASSDFPGPFTIHGLTFYNTQRLAKNGFNRGTYTISLSSTHAKVDVVLI